jgi:hypothetical protein
VDRVGHFRLDAHRAVEDSLTHGNGGADLRSCFKPPETSVQPVKAASAEVADDYLVFMHADGTVSAIFHLDVVEGWSCDESPNQTTEV